MRSTSSRLLPTGRKNKQTIITNSRAWLAYINPIFFRAFCKQRENKRMEKGIWDTDAGDLAAASRIL